MRTTTGTDDDLDASAPLLDASGTVPTDGHFAFHNNLTSPDGSVEHTGAHLTGEGEGDDEAVKANLAAVPAGIGSSSRCPSTTRRTGAGASARCAPPPSSGSATGPTTANSPYDPSEDASTETATVFGELYRHGTEWMFRAAGQGYASQLAAIAADFGVTCDVGRRPHTRRFRPRRDAPSDTGRCPTRLHPPRAGICK